MLSSLSTENLIPVDHPIRRIRVVVVLAALNLVAAIIIRLARPVPSDTTDVATAGVVEVRPAG